MRWLMNHSLGIVVMAGASVAMYLPFLHALVLRDWLTARSFFYSGTLALILTVLIGLAHYATQSRNIARSHLVSMLAIFAVLPVLLAVPFYESVRNTTFLNAYVEMVSSLTTTGASLYEPARLAPSVHLWRALVGWMGGYFVWVAAIAILAPMNLGGFEVIAPAAQGRAARRAAPGSRSGDPRERLLRHGQRMLPLYAGLTAILWLGLVVLGERPFVALCHAMSVMATSGISPVGGLSGAQAGLVGEVLILVFFVFAISRQSFAQGLNATMPGRVWADPEFRMGLLAVIVIPVFLFLRHWWGAYEVAEQQNVVAAIRALWGGIFTVASFLSTTGFASADWVTARDWSGLQTPGLILVGLAVTGGGVATTAGGVKLLRVYALYKHGMRETERLFHPSSVGGSGAQARRIRREGAHIAWIFFMLFALSVALVMAALSLTGLGFEPATVLTVTALSTTGPLAALAGESPIMLGALNDVAKGVLAAAMVLGRLETLAIIALLNPEFWRQ